MRVGLTIGVLAGAVGVLSVGAYPWLGVLGLLLAVIWSV